jgi:hypothetical protein
VQVLEHGHGGAKKSRIPICIQSRKNFRKNREKLTCGKGLRCFSKLTKSANADTTTSAISIQPAGVFQVACHAGNCIRAGGQGS